MLIIGTPGEFRDLFQEEEEIRYKTVLRPQTSGPCLSYGPHGCEIPCKSGEEREGCPHIDNPDVVCPIKDVLTAADKQLYADPAPEFPAVAPDETASYEIALPSLANRKDAWTEDESWIVARADTWKEAIVSYRGRFPHSKRTDKAIQSRWVKLRAATPPQPAPEPVEDLDIDERDPDQRVSEIRRPRFRPGDKVRVTKPALRGITGEIKRYYEPTEDYLLLVDGAPDLMWIAEEYLEAL